VSAKGDEFAATRKLPKGEWITIGSVRVRVRPASDLLDEGEVNSANWTRPELLVSTPEADRVRRLRSVLPAEEGSDILIGRSSKKNDIVLDDEHVSRRHLRIVVRGGRHFAEDLGSRWGTYVNGTRVDLSVVLNHGDEIRLGRSVLRFVKFSDGFEFVTSDSAGGASLSERQGPSWRHDPEADDGMTLTATTLLAIPVADLPSPSPPTPTHSEPVEDAASASISQKLSNWMRQKKPR
jgi:pSer/pThr/pTyr-binding forkhead associated (FHA) protein